MTYTLPAPRVEFEPLWCEEDDCDGFYQPYSDGSLSCYCGSVSHLSVDDVDISMVLVSTRDEC